VVSRLYDRNEHAAAMNRLMTAKTMQQTFEVQSEYVKTAYEAFVAQASRIGELYTDLAKESCEPFEGIYGKKTSAT
jgi:hypothetical protein